MVKTFVHNGRTYKAGGRVNLKILGEGSLLAIFMFHNDNWYVCSDSEYLRGAPCPDKGGFINSYFLGETICPLWEITPLYNKPKDED